LLLCACLYLTTKLWGQPSIAAQTWQAKQVGSARATEYLSNIYLQAGEISPAQQLVANHITVCKHCTNSQAISLFLSCYASKPKATQEAYSALLNQSKTTVDARGVGVNLTQVHKLITNNSCPYISLTEIKALNTAFLQSPISPFNKKLPFLQNLYSIALQEEDRDEAIRLLYLAWDEQSDNAIANELVLMLVSSNRVNEADRFVTEQVCKRTTLNPIIAKVNSGQCSFFKSKISTILENNRIDAIKPTTHFIKVKNDN
jgi:hypothetical protein